MLSIPLYIPAVFILSAFITLYFLYKASHNSKAVLIISLIWLALQAAVGLSGFYLVTDTMPPRFAALLPPALLLILILFLTKKGKGFIDSLDLQMLTRLHGVRILVELVLYWLFIYGTIPQLMTFEGRNFDILAGLSAPVVAVFAFRNGIVNKKLLLWWNMICLALLLNIVINAVLAAPSPFQQFAFDQPDIGILYFPFVWLPCFIVPVVLFSHLVVIRRLTRKQVV